MRSDAVRSAASIRKGRPSRANQARMRGVEHGAEVVRVRHERVLVAALEHGARASPSRERRCRGRRGRAAPTRASGRRASSTGSRSSAQQLRHLALHEVEREVAPPVRDSARAPRASRRAWRSCSSARAARARRERSRRPQHLAGDDVEERQAVLDLEQRLGLASSPCSVPRPPFSFTTTARSSASRAPSGRPGAPRRPAATPPARSRTRAAAPARPPSRRASWRANVSIATSGRPSARIFSAAALHAGDPMRLKRPPMRPIRSLDPPDGRRRTRSPTTHGRDNGGRPGRTAPDVLRRRRRRGQACDPPHARRRALRRLRHRRGPRLRAVRRPRDRASALLSAPAGRPRRERRASTRSPSTGRAASRAWWRPASRST